MLTWKSASHSPSQLTAAGEETVYRIYKLLYVLVTGCLASTYVCVVVLNAQNMVSVVVLTRHAWTQGSTFVYVCSLHTHCPGENLAFLLCEVFFFVFVVLPSPL